MADRPGDLTEPDPARGSGMRRAGLTGDVVVTAGPQRTGEGPRADPATVSRYVTAGWWGDRSYADHLRDQARRRGDALALVEGHDRLTWRAYDDRSDQLAAALVGMSLEPGERVAVLLPDGPAVHVAYMAVEKAGLVVVGIGPRAGTREIEHLLTVSGAAALVSPAHHRGQDLASLVVGLRRRGLPLRHHVVLGDGPGPEHRHPGDVGGDSALVSGDQGGAAGEVVVDGVGVALPAPGDARVAVEGRELGPDQLFLLNSTSGTTGLPKCVMHTQNRWMYFHQLAVAAGELTSGDVFMSVIPAPFGFGLWTAHVTPLLLGAPTVVMRRFDAADAIRRIERERVTVLAAVSTQFIMMLNQPTLADADLGSLRVLFTGGEAVPYQRAGAFEERTGAKVLQFYGSNETGALSRTSVHDTRDDRLRTAGQVIGDMDVRLLADDGADVTATGGPGQPACRGPATCLGYYGDPAANEQLFTAGGWMLTGDVATVDERGYLRVVGRKSDFIIRGGKNISAPAVEAEVLTHPGVDLAAAVAMPSEVFGERVCLYLVASGSVALTLDDVTAHLANRGVSKEWWPEHLVVVDELPRSSGGKVAKGELREDARRRAADGLH
ncbi:MAG: AMP-binding protein [Acidimicrobiales bacterium]